MIGKFQAVQSEAGGPGTGAVLLIAGGGLLGLSMLGGFGAPVSVVLASLAASLAVYGIYLGPTRSGLLRSGLRQGSGSMALCRDDPSPVFLTDLNGTVLDRNPAAVSAGLADLWAPQSGCTRERLLREAVESGSAVADIAPGDQKVSVFRFGRRLLWRLDMASGRPEAVRPDFSSVPVPWLRLDEGEQIVAMNAAAEELCGAGIGSLRDVIADPPLNPGAVHVLRSSGCAVRVLPACDGSGTCELFLVPLAASEVSGLVPDQFLEDFPVALARLAADGELAFANRAARGLLGESAQPGVNFTALAEGLAKPVPERLADAARGRGLGRPEVARSLAAGEELFLQVSFTRTVFEGAPALLAVLSDATELKTLEAQFVQSQKMQAVGQLAGGVAHDFNNLLTAINGHCDLLLMRHDMADVEHGDLMQIRQNANRAAALVRQLLAFSRKQTLRPTVISLPDTLSELTHLLNRLLTEKVTLRIENGADLAPVRVDEQQLEQVIMNLVVNARDAMPRGGEVRVATRNEKLDEDLHRDRAVVLKGDWVVIEVADSGTGIPPEKLNKIFEPFFTTKQVGEGTGLGLSTAYGIVKQTGGFIFADSPAGGGAVFSIYLPAFERTQAPEAEREEEVARRPRDLSGHGLVLLVEDEDAVRSFAARALKLRGYTVVEAASGEEALQILSEQDLQVDIMLSDVIMPGLDGPAWVRQARRTIPDAKVIFMSGYAEDAFNGGDSGIPDAAFLPKPFSLPELTQRVKDALEG